MTMHRPQGTLQQEYSLVELEQARSAELEARVAEGERIEEAKAAGHGVQRPGRVRRAIARLLRCD